jgi:hypothetical protein
MRAVIPILPPAISPTRIQSWLLRQEGAKKAKEALISGFLPFLLLLAFFASISTFFMRSDFINVS